MNVAENQKWQGNGEEGEKGRQECWEMGKNRTRMNKYGSRAHRKWLRCDTKILMVPNRWAIWGHLFSTHRINNNNAHRHTHKHTHNQITGGEWKITHKNIAIFQIICQMMASLNHWTMIAGASARASIYHRILHRIWSRSRFDFLPIPSFSHRWSSWSCAWRFHPLHFMVDDIWMSTLPLSLLLYRSLASSMSVFHYCWNFRHLSSSCQPSVRWERNIFKSNKFPSE